MGAFAVPKTETEDRWISPCEFLNSITPDSLVKKVEMPYLPMLGTLSVGKHQRLWVSKRGARHYFHVLRVGKPWRRLLRAPALVRHGRRVHARARAWPMGYKASVSFAQSVAERSAAAAGLPASRRCYPGQPTPLAPPVWGAIVDDLWVIGVSGQEESEAAAQWPHSMDKEWDRIGVEPHPTKKVDLAADAEVQGALVRAEQRDMALSPKKLRDLLAGMLWIATAHRPGLAAVERLVGRVGYAHMFRPALRACLWGHLPVDP